ncbi:transposase [Sporosarcina sp. BP05]|uniref:transposase n=1 Tax=Sporosarcina sp. BP05 TaxID=2758726 RepID=UPI001648E576|nr:transposase [Sporosarcina sp. BP05]
MNLENKKTHRQSHPKHKLYAVKEVLENNRHKKEVAAELGVSLGTIINWIKQYESPEIKPLQPLIVGDTPELKNELKRLRDIEKQYKDQQLEIEILKKFLAFLKENE